MQGNYEGFKLDFNLNKIEFKSNKGSYLLQLFYKAATNDIKEYIG